MTNEQIKEQLTRLESEVPDFTVVQSGKASKKVNGLYKPDSREIILHNKNFFDDNSLMYTAIHEFAHHVHITRAVLPVTSRAHTTEFWAQFHTLLQKAEKLEVYESVFTRHPDFISLTKVIRENYIVKNGQLMKDFGKILLRAYTLCEHHHVRFEDYADRVLLLPKTSVKSLIQIHNLDVDPGLGYDTMKLVAGIRDDDEREEVIELIAGGEQSIDTIKQKLKKPREKQSRREILIDEQERLQRNLARITERLNHIAQELETCDEELPN